MQFDGPKGRGAKVIVVRLNIIICTEKENDPLNQTQEETTKEPGVQAAYPHYVYVEGIYPAHSSEYEHTRMLN